LQYDTDKQTFDLVKKSFLKNKYPFHMDAKQKASFDAFLCNYIIEETFFDEGIRLFSLDEVFWQN